MRARRASACYRDMWQRGHVVQSIAFGAKLPAKLPILDAAIHRHRVALAVYLQHTLQTLQRDQLPRRVSDAIKRMSRAERLHLAGAADQFLHLLYRFGIVQIDSAVGVIAGPIAWILDHDNAPQYGGA